jgi:hypothetical protein
VRAFLDTKHERHVIFSTIKIKESSGEMQIKYFDTKDPSRFLIKFIGRRFCFRRRFLSPSSLLTMKFSAVILAAILGTAAAGRPQVSVRRITSSFDDA